MKKVEDEKIEGENIVSNRKYDDFMISYREHLESLSKEELTRLILGDDDVVPMITRKEPTFSRPQLIWAMHKYNQEYLKNKTSFTDITDEFHTAEDQVEYIISIIQGDRWDTFYNYDWIRFDIKKPGFKYFVAGLLLSIVGLAASIKWIFELF